MQTKLFLCLYLWQHEVIQLISCFLCSISEHRCSSSTVDSIQHNDGECYTISLVMSVRILTRLILAQGLNPVLQHVFLCNSWMLTTKLLMWNSKLIYTKPIIYNLISCIIMLWYSSILPINLDSTTMPRTKLDKIEWEGYHQPKLNKCPT
jgi:hypothetical protein